MAELGWIGLGSIGTPLALRLLDRGHSLSVWGRTGSRLATALDRGAREARSARELGQRCEAVFLCVTDTAAVESVLFGEAGLAEAGRPELLVVDHSTIHPVRTREFADRLGAQQAGHLVDAPVSGGEAGAREGTLAVMLGGEAEQVERARPWIAAYGSKITHLGPSGCGQAAKSCNQAIAIATIMAWAEMLAYAGRFGLDIPKMVEAFEGGFADSLVRRRLAGPLLSGAFPGHYADIIPKDLDIVCDVAQSLQTPVPMTALVTSLYRHHRALRNVSADASLGLLSLFAGQDAGRDAP